MRSSLVLTLAGIFLFANIGALEAQTKPNTKPKAKTNQRFCFTKSEHAVEGEVRYGVRLREHSWSCDTKPYSMDTWKIWSAFDKSSKDQFVKLTEDRKKTFEREFPNNYKALISTWDGRIVLHYRYDQLNGVMCSNLKKQLTDIQAKGWKEFQKQAKKNKPEVMMDYKVCPGR